MNCCNQILFMTPLTANLQPPHNRQTACGFPNQVTGSPQYPAGIQMSSLNQQADNWHHTKMSTTWAPKHQSSKMLIRQLLPCCTTVKGSNLWHHKVGYLSWWIDSSPLDKMATILQMIFSYAFFVDKKFCIFVFWLKFHWSLLLRVKLTQHLLR